MKRNKRGRFLRTSRSRWCHWSGVEDCGVEYSEKSRREDSFARNSSNTMPPYGALPTGNTSSLLTQQTAGICWCGLYIAISGFLIASFWQWSTQETGDLELLLCRPFLMMAMDGPRRAVPAHSCRNSTSSDEHDGKKDRRGGSTGYSSSSSGSAHKFWIHWPNQIR
jgi:hypothetical protein